MLSRLHCQAIVNWGLTRAPPTSPLACSLWPALLITAQVEQKADGHMGRKCPVSGGAHGLGPLLANWGPETVARPPRTSRHVCCVALLHTWETEPQRGLAILRSLS